MGGRGLYAEFFPLLASIWGGRDAAQPPNVIHMVRMFLYLDYFLVRPHVKYELTINPWLVWK